MPGSPLRSAWSATTAGTGRGRRTGRGVQARPGEEGGWRLYGEVERVLDGHSAGLLVAAHTGGFARARTRIFLVAEGAQGLVRMRQTSLDETRAQGRVQLRQVRAEVLGEEDGDVLGALASVGDGAAAVLAVEAVGAADRALERTIAPCGSGSSSGGRSDPSRR